MAKVMENLKTINSVVRTVLLIFVVSVISAAGYLIYDRYVRPGFAAEELREQIAQIQVKYQEQSEELDKVRTALKLLKIDQRKALVRVVEMGNDPQTSEPFMDVEFIEVDAQGQPLGDPRSFHLKGTEVHIDSWVVKFEDEYVEQAAELRAASLCLFKSIYGDGDSRGAYSLDRADHQENTAYGTTESMHEFEKQIWADFWRVANDPTLQSQLGIRANHGEIAYMQVRAGQIYQVDLRASGGLSLTATNKSAAIFEQEKH